MLMKTAPKRKKTIFRSFILWLLLIAAAVFLISRAVSWFMETGQDRAAAFRLLRLNIADVRQDIKDAGGFAQTDPAAAALQDEITGEVIEETRHRHVGERGLVIIAAEDGTIISDPNGGEGKSLASAGLSLDRGKMPEGIFRAEVYGEPCFCMADFSDGFYVAASIPASEVLQERNLSAMLDTAGDALVLAVLVVLTALLVKNLVIRNIDRINRSLSKITGGDLDEKVEVRSHEEFSGLSDKINATVHSLKEYTEAEKARMEAEMALARDIQQSALPLVFPPYPDRKEFSLFASMRAAREVGGDFYDFYMPGKSTLAFLAADVSGKGIPAAMFMMSCKRTLRDYAERGDPPADIAEQANRELCEGNEAKMFVTVWMGFLDTDSGLVRFINAGHNPPVLIRGGQASFIPMEANLFMGFLKDADYREQTIRLQPGDCLFLYTDGITEAIDPEKKQFGKERLLKTLSADFGTGEDACREICGAVLRDADTFAAGAPQFDDMTVLCLCYHGKQ